MEPIPGVMSRFSEKDHHLLAFISVNAKHMFCKNAVVLIPGLTDGMMTMSYTTALHCELLNIDYSLVQVNLSSSFYQFGFHSLHDDMEELTQLVNFLKEKWRFNKVIFLGHSTGCHDSLYFLRYSSLAKSIDAVVLQGAVSDRDGIVVMKETPSMLSEAKELKQNGKENKILEEFHLGAPITASRFLSLAGRLTPDDMFSVDLSSDELTPILSPVQVPILMCFSDKDEYVPDETAQRNVAQRMTNVLKQHNSSGIVEALYLHGNHGLSDKEFYEPFVEKVCIFIKSYLLK